MGRIVLIAALAALALPTSAIAPPREANLVPLIAVSPAPASSEVVVVTGTLVDRGPDSVTDGTLVTTLPAGLTLLAAHPAKGHCAGSSTVICSFGLVGRGNQALHDNVVSVRLLARIDEPGSYEISATASAPTATETIPGDNSTSRSFAADAYDGPRPFARVLLKLVSATPKKVVVRVTALGPDRARNVELNGRRLGDLTPGTERASTFLFERRVKSFSVVESHAGATQTALDVDF